MAGVTIESDVEKAGSWMSKRNKEKATHTSSSTSSTARLALKNKDKAN